ncbi:MAG: hypothetical protein R6V18_06120 [Desulfuromonadaceae bacterium]
MNSKMPVGALLAAPMFATQYGGSGRSKQRPYGGTMTRRMVLTPPTPP